MLKFSVSSLLLLLALCCSFSAMAGKEIRLTDKGKNVILVTENTYHKLKVDFSLNHITVNDIITAEGTFSDILVEGFSSRLDLGQPKLPVSRSLIEMPLGADIEIKLISTTYTEYSLAELGILNPIMPVQPPVAKSDKSLPPFAFDKKTYKRNAFVADELVTVEALGIMRGSNLGRLNVSAFQYNPKTGKISYPEPTAPFYQFGRMTVVLCDTWYTVNLNTLKMTSGDVRAYSGTCGMEVSPLHALNLIRTHLETYGFDAFSLFRVTLPR